MGNMENGADEGSDEGAEGRMNEGEGESCEGFLGDCCKFMYENDLGDILIFGGLYNIDGLFASVRLRGLILMGVKLIN